MASLGSLVAGIAHEVNTPLGVAVSAGSYLARNIHLAQEDLKDNKLTKRGLNEYMGTLEESTDIINVNLSRASELIQSFKKISINQSIERKVDFNIYDYIQSVLIALKHEYKHTEHTFEIDCSKELVIESYQGAFSQILTNCIMNSLIHGLEDKKAGIITISAHMLEEDLLELKYSDNGVGIDEDHLKYVFDPFFND